MLIRLSFVFAVVIVQIWCSPTAANSQRYLPFKDRQLHIMTYNSNVNEESSKQGKVFHHSVNKLVKPNVKVEIVGKGVRWKPLLFLNKPIGYLKHVEGLASHYAAQGRDPDTVFVLVADSDTVWSAVDVDVLWRKFDAIRGDRPVVVSTEMNCWVGRMCTAEDIAAYYPTTPEGMSVFLNSGAYIGTLPAVVHLLQALVVREEIQNFSSLDAKALDASRFMSDQQLLTKHWGSGLPPLLSLDTRQELFATLNINHLKTRRAMVTRTCKKSAAANAKVVFDCMRINPKILLEDRAFSFDQHCSLSRNASQVQDARIRDIVAGLAPDPVLWHGNGDGKRVYETILKKYLNCSSGLSPPGIIV